MVDLDHGCQEQEQEGKDQHDKVVVYGTRKRKKGVRRRKVHLVLWAFVSKCGKKIKKIHVLLGKVFGTVTTLQVPSTEAVTSCDASPLKERQVMGRLWILGTVMRTCNDLLLHTRTLMSDEPNAISFPSELRKTEVDEEPKKIKNALTNHYAGRNKEMLLR